MNVFGFGDDFLALRLIAINLDSISDEDVTFT